MAATDSLEELLAGVIDGLGAAVPDPRHDWHQPVICCLDETGRAVSRTVVLRGFSRGADGEPRLRFHTDSRSRKVAEILASPEVCWLFYDRERKVQLRALASAHVHRDDELAEEAWAAATLSSRRCYLAPHAPSSVQESWDPNLPEHLLRTLPGQEESEAGRARFAVVETRVTELDRLELRHDGHVRSRWRWLADGSVDAHWLAP